MNAPGRFLILAPVAAGLFYLFHRLIDPAPIPAVTAVIAGLIAVVVRTRRSLLIGAIIAGLALGIGIHAWSHIVENRVASLPAFAAHLAGDAALALAGALVILGIVAAVDRQFFRNVLVLVALASLSACSITPPPISVEASDPSNPNAAESAGRPMRPGLMAGARNFLPREPRPDAQQMSHAGHDMRQKIGAEIQARNQAEEEVAAELKAEPGPTKPTSEQLQSLHPADYTCPMHPEIHSDKPGSCPKCGMPLVTRSSLEKKQP